VRVQAVINELGGMEKVDIVQFTEDTATLIASALAPAKEIEVILNEESKSAVALVPDDQLSLAIGREGQNVRLAAKVTGWKIDIKGKSEYSKKDEMKDTSSETQVKKEKTGEGKIEVKKPKAKKAKKVKVEEVEGIKEDKVETNEAVVEAESPVVEEVKTEGKVETKPDDQASS